MDAPLPPLTGMPFLRHRQGCSAGWFPPDEAAAYMHCKLQVGNQTTHDHVQLYDRDYLILCGDHGKPRYVTSWYDLREVSSPSK